MSPIKYTNVLLLLLSVLYVAVKAEEEIKAIEEIDNIFAEIEEDHNKLKKVFKEVIFNKETPKCQCVPFYLCNAEEGKIITDGEGLIKSRGGYNDENSCEDKQDVCCMPPDIRLSPKILTVEEKVVRCGYGMKSSSNNKQSYAEFGEFPWTVMIANLHEGRGEYKCVGSLIHPEVVLTAAHCVDETKSILVRAGDLNTRDTSEPKPHQFRTISKVIKHPKFQIANLKYNVALLITQSPFDLDDHINTACLADSFPDSTIENANECIVTGWGIDKPEGDYSSIMRKIKFLLIDSAKCENDFRKTRLGGFFKLHKTFACAYNKYGSDACEGNGGGPLVCPLVDQPGRYQQVGINSWGIDCAGNNPSVFTDIPEIKDWIDQQFDTLNLSKDYYTYEDERNRYF